MSNIVFADDTALLLSGLVLGLVTILCVALHGRFPSNVKQRLSGASPILRPESNKSTNQVHARATVRASGGDTESYAESNTNDTAAATAAPKNAHQAKACRDMIVSLSDEEKEKAARSSYRYFAAAVSASPPPPGERDKYAMAMARRHLVAEKGDEAKAFAKMRATIKYRDKMNVDAIRRCFYDANGVEEDEKQTYREHREGLGRELSEGKLFVRGQSKRGHALYVVQSHKFVSGFDPEWYMKYNIYTLERAIACTERATDGEVEKVVVLFDFGKYSARMRPPLGLSKDLQNCLRDHYPERVERVILADTPTIFRAFWSLIRPFIDPHTKDKIKFVTGNEQKMDIVGDIISEENAMPFMLASGRLESDLDMKTYLHGTPFDCLCKEVP